MPRPISPAKDAEVRSFLAQLESEARHENNTPTIQKTVAQFASMAVAPIFGVEQPPAPATINRDDAVKAYRGSVYVAVGSIARKVAQQEVKVAYRRVTKNGTEYEPANFRHPLVQLFEQVNPLCTQYDLWYYTIGWMMLTGEAFWWKARNGFRRPAEIWPVPTQWTLPVPSRTKFIGSYRVKNFFQKDTELPAEDVVHLRNPNLDWSGNGRFHGHATIMAGAEMIEAETQMHRRLLWSLKNFSPPGLHYETDQELTDDQLKDYYGQILAQHRLAETTGRPIISHSGLKATVPTVGKNEVDYRESLALAMDYTLGIFGVPRAVVGLVADVNRANLQGALLTFAENTINPLLVLLGQHLTQNLASEFDPDLCIYFNPITIEDADRVRRDVETASRCGAITPNEVRDFLLDKHPFPSGGDRAMYQGKEFGFGTIAEPVPVEDPPGGGGIGDEGNRRSPSATAGT